jgi:hypothetical protein
MTRAKPDRTVKQVWRCHPSRVLPGREPGRIFRFFANSRRADRPPRRPTGIDLFEPPSDGTGGSATTEGPPHALSRVEGAGTLATDSSFPFLLLAKSDKSPRHARFGRVETPASRRILPDTCKGVRMYRTTRAVHSGLSARLSRQAEPFMGLTVRRRDHQSLGSRKAAQASPFSFAEILWQSGFVYAIR